jgi:RNA polymerase sigma-70 factor (ECF subfamily)
MEQRQNVESIYKRYLNDVYRYLLHLSKIPQTAADLTQETFYRAYLYLENYKGEKVKPWLLRVARNTFIDWYRREKRHLPIDPAALEVLENKSTAGPEEKFIVAEELQEWLVLVASLPSRQKQTVLYCDYYGFTYQEAAEILGISLINVKVSLFRGRKKLRELLEKEGEK